MKKVDLFVVGAGAAGVSAAVAARKAGAGSILIADRNMKVGGVLPQCLHSGFGMSLFGRELTGPEFAAFLQQELEGMDISLNLGTSVLSVSPEKTAVLSGKNGLSELSFDKMILASGCLEKTIGSLPVSGPRPSGIFTAGQAQEMVNLHHLSLGNEILILGSGDLGMIMARRFVLEGKHVIAVVEKEDHYGGLARNYHRCLEQYSVPLILNAEIIRIFGSERITAAEIRFSDTDKTKIIPCDTLVTAIGLTPDRSLLYALGEPEWLRLCGNCSRIYELVDSARADSQHIGKTFGGAP